MEWKFAIALCALLIGNANTAEGQASRPDRWVVFQRDADSTDSIDAVSLQVRGDIRRFWTRRNFSRLQRGSVSYDMYRYELNCSQQTVRALAYASYNSRGIVIEQYDWSQRTDRPARAIVPDSLGERLSSELCSPS